MSHIYIWSGPYRQPDRKISVFYDSSVLGSGKKRSFYGQTEHKGIKEPYSNAIIGAKFSRFLAVRMGGGPSPLMVSLTVKILFFSDHFPLRKYEKKTSLFLLHSPYESDFKGFGLPHLSMVDWTQWVSKWMKDQWSERKRHLSTSLYDHCLVSEPKDSVQNPNLFVSVGNIKTDVS